MLPSIWLVSSAARRHVVLDQGASLEHGDLGEHAAGRGRTPGSARRTCPRRSRPPRRRLRPDRLAVSSRDRVLRRCRSGRCSVAIWAGGRTAPLRLAPPPPRAAPAEVRVEPVPLPCRSGRAQLDVGARDRPVPSRAGRRAGRVGARAPRPSRGRTGGAGLVSPILGRGARRGRGPGTSRAVGGRRWPTWPCLWWGRADRLLLGGLAGIDVARGGRVALRLGHEGDPSSYSS